MITDDIQMKTDSRFSYYFGVALGVACFLAPYVLRPYI